MFTPFVRLILLFLCAIVSIISAIFGVWSLLLMASAGSVYLLFGYFRESTIPLSLTALRNNDYIKAEKFLSDIIHPERLSKKNRAYFYFCKAMIERENDNFDEATPLFKLALGEGLKNENDRAVALLALTDIEMVKGNKEIAKEYFLQIKGLKVKPLLMPSIRKMQHYLALDN